MKRIFLPGNIAKTKTNDNIPGASCTGHSTGGEQEEKHDQNCARNESRSPPVSNRNPLVESTIKLSNDLQHHHLNSVDSGVIINTHLRTLQNQNHQSQNSDNTFVSVEGERNCTFGRQTLQQGNRVSLPSPTYYVDTNHPSHHHHQQQHQQISRTNDCSDQLFPIPMNPKTMPPEVFREKRVVKSLSDFFGF